MVNISFIIKGSLDKSVPILNLARALNSHGFIVQIFCGNISNKLLNLLEKENIKIFNFEINNHNSFVPFIGKIISWIVFRVKVKRILKKLKNEYIYIGTADTAIALRGLIEKKFVFFLHLREFYDQDYLYMKFLKYPSKMAFKVVVPEENRAFLYFNFFKLDRMPLILPNKTYGHPRSKKLDIGFLPLDIQNRIKEKKNIIYQGHLHKERDLSNFLKEFHELSGFNIILMGKDYGMVDIYRKIYSNLIYIPFVNPPYHLHITSWAHIGIITYDINSLNTIYCAPNKIWEYNGFGIPVIGSNNPGLKNQVQIYRNGEIVNFEYDSEIVYAIRKIDDNYTFYSNNSLNFFNSFEFDSFINEKLFK